MSLRTHFVIYAMWPMEEFQIRETKHFWKCSIWLALEKELGSGIPNLYQVWRDEKWVEPTYTENYAPDRTTLKLFVNSVDDDNLIVNPSVNSSVKLTEKNREVLELISVTQNITVSEIAKKLEKSWTAISDRIKILKEILKDKNLIKRIGSAQSDRWEIQQPKSRRL